MVCESSHVHKLWKAMEPDPAALEDFRKSLPVSEILCRVLLNRGIRTVAEAECFLRPDPSQMHDPGRLDGMDWAVQRTRKAIEGGEKIMVHGDYDVDGITSTALLVRVLRALRADVCWYVPHRQREGYDIQGPGVESAVAQGAKLVITVDCGTSAVEEIEHAKSLGLDVIVTDHHESGLRVADALAVINPHKPGCSYPFKDLAGVGVAFKFAEALVRDFGYDVDVFRRRFADLAAIGTVADVVPLLDENRIFVKYGLEEIPRSGKHGIRALLRRAGLDGKPITSYDLGFVLGPRLNAAGRLDDASIALDLLLTKDEAEAERLAQLLDACNRERQQEQERITREALEQIANRQLDQKAKVLVLSSKGWHPGIVGIVASKITDRYHRPTVMIAMDEDGEAGVGSARSIGPFDLFGALMRCRTLLERCGGHAKAAGLSISAARLHDFDAAINEVADEILTESDLIPQVEVDAELAMDDVTRDLAGELSLLEPLGYCNREPTFMSKGVLILDKTRMGSTGAHLKLKLATECGRPAECVAFGWGERADLFRVGSLLDLCYNIRINRFNGSETLQLVLRDGRPSDSSFGDAISPGSLA